MVGRASGALVRRLYALSAPMKPIPWAATGFRGISRVASHIPDPRSWLRKVLVAWKGFWGKSPRPLESPSETEFTCRPLDAGLGGAVAVYMSDMRLRERNSEAKFATRRYPLGFDLGNGSSDVFRQTCNSLAFTMRIGADAAQPKRS